MRELIEYIARSLVDHPDDIKITEIDGECTVVFELRCNKEDTGKVIGKSGKTVSAMRTLLNTLAAKNGKRAILEIVD